MILLLICTMLLLGTPIKMDLSSENFRICKKLTDPANPTAGKLFLECSCEVRQNFTVGYIFDFSITQVLIKGCGDVIIDFGALKDLKLTKIEFVDLNKLTIFPFALSSIQDVKVLKISDVSVLNIMQYAFAELNFINKFIIRNVTANTIKSDAFSAISAVNQFLIEDSTFQEVEPFAFSIQNTVTFNVINTEFHVMANYSLLLHNVKDVIFEKCVFQDTENNSFVFSFVDSVSYKSCQFWEVETTAFRSNSSNMFSITDSYIENLKPDAFGGLDLQQSFVFTDNIIDMTNETSFSGLFSAPFNELNLSYCCNIFTCNCNIFWMWGLKDFDKNNTMLENSYCSGKNKYPVNSYEPIIDSKNNCITLELKSSINEQFVEERKITTDCKSDDCLLSVISSAGCQIKLVFRTVLWTLIIIKLL